MTQLLSPDYRPTIIDVEYHANRAVQYIEKSSVDLAVQHFLIAHACQQKSRGAEEFTFPAKELFAFVANYGHPMTEDEMEALLKRIELWELLQN